MPASARRGDDAPRELRRIRVRRALPDRDARNGIRRPRCSPPSASRRTPARRSPRTRRRRCDRATRTSRCARSRSCRRRAFALPGAPGERALERVRVQVRHARHERRRRRARHRRRPRSCVDAAIVPSASMSIATSRAQPVGKQRGRRHEPHDAGSMTATSATASGDTGLTAIAAAGRSSPSSNTTRVVLRDRERRMTGDEALDRARRRVAHAPARGRDARGCRRGPRRGDRARARGAASG